MDVKEHFIAVHELMSILGLTRFIPGFLLQRSDPLIAEHLFKFDLIRY